MNRLTCLTLVTLFVVAGVAAASSFSVDENPAGFSSVYQYGDDLMLAMWDIQFQIDLTASTGAAGNSGSEFNGTYFYSTRWAANLIHETDLAGVTIRSFSIPGVSGLRDLAYDGTHFYGGAAGGTIWQMDFSSASLVGSISGGFQSRAIAYDPDTDQLYCSNWADPVWMIDPATGGINGTFNLGTTTSTYGFAYETQCSGVPTLWVYDQTAGGAVIHMWDLGSGSFTGVTHDTNSDLMPNSGIAGGLWFDGGTIGGLSQGVPDVGFGYELCGTAAPITIEIVPLNGTIFNPGDWIEYAVTLTNPGGTAVEVTARTFASGPADFDITLQGPITFTIQAGATIGPVSLDYRIPPAAPPIAANICAEAIPTRGGRASDCYLLSVGSAGETITGGLCPAFILQDPYGPPPLARILVASIWVCDADLDSIHHVSSDGTVLASIPAPCGSPQALSINGYGGDPISLGLYVSCTDNDYIYHVSTLGVVMDSFPAAGDDPECLGLSEHTAFGFWTPPDTLGMEYSEIITHVWTTHESELCLFDPGSESYTSTIPAPGPSASGLEWAASAFGVSELWVCDNEVDMIYKVTTDDGEILTSFPSPGTNPTGIAAGLIIAKVPDDFEVIVLTLYESEDVADTLYTVGAGSGDVLESYYLPPSCE